MQQGDLKHSHLLENNLLFCELFLFKATAKQSLKKIKAGVVTVCTNLVLLLPVLKQLHECVALLHQVRVHPLSFGKGQDGLQSALRLTDCPQTSAGGRKTVIHQPFFILNHLFEDSCLTFHPVREFV